MGAAEEQSKDVSKTADFDAILEVVGTNGRYQKLMAVVTSLAFVPNAMAAMAAVFTAATPEHWCDIPELSQLNREQQQKLGAPPGEYGGYDVCRKYDVSNYSLLLQEVNVSGLAEYPVHVDEGVVDCGKFSYDTSVYKSTIITEWDLVCSHLWMKAFSTSLYMLGQLIGVVVFGHIADIIGRRRGWLLAITVAIAASTATAFVSNYWAYTMLRLIVGMCTLGGCVCTFTLGMELTGVKDRLLVSVLPHVGFILGYTILAAVAYFIRDWSHLHLALSLISVPMIGSYWILGESPRWLLKTGRIKEAKTEIRRIARMNGRVITDEFLSTIGCPLMQDVKSNEEVTYTILDLLRTPNMRCKTLNMWFIWFVTSLVYFGLHLGTGYLPGSPHFNLLVSGSVEVIVQVILLFILEKSGRRILLLVSFLLGGGACLLGVVIPADDNLTWLTIGLSCIGKFGASGAFVLVYISTTELSPTLVRGIGLGAGSMSARIGSIISPFIADMGNAIWTPLPQVVFASLSLAAGLLSLLLPETLNRKLPDTLADGEAFGKNRLSRRLCCDKTSSDDTEDAEMALKA